MQETQLNSLAIQAKTGDKRAYWLVVGEFHILIMTLSDKYRGYMYDPGKFEDQCFKRIEEAIETYDADRGSFKAHVEAKIYERLRRFIKRNNARKYKIETVSMVTKEGVEIDVEDELALVDRSLSLNEKITGLAAGDPKKLAILDTWMDYKVNDSKTARLLAQRYGGNIESHRKNITRFRSSCQKALAYAI